MGIKCKEISHLPSPKLCLNGSFKNTLNFLQLHLKRNDINLHCNSQIEAAYVFRSFLVDECY